MMDDINYRNRELRICITDITEYTAILVLEAVNKCLQEVDSEEEVSENKEGEEVSGATDERELRICITDITEYTAILVLEAVNKCLQTVPYARLSFSCLEK